jgi:hypothetical protein
MIDPSREIPKKTRVVQAPSPTDPSLPPSIYWLELEEGLEVEWRWIELPDGHKVVTDYRVFPIESRAF